jgi:folate-binding protein YgfZ
MPVAQLEDREVVRIAGADAATLLQNVVTLDMESVESHGSGYGALLTPQGKVLWDFVLHKSGDGYVADLRKGEAAAFAKRLTLYRLRAKVEIGLAPELAVFVRWGEEAASDPQPQRLGEVRSDPRLATLGARWVVSPGPVAVDATASDWHRHRIALAIPEGGVDFVFGDAFPFDAGMDSLNGVAFEKGCYIGQEVVSRMRHRGTARRRIVALHARGPLPEPGTEIVAGERPLGRLGSSAGESGIGVLRLDRLRAALDEHVPVRAGAKEVSVALPAWATYGWPAAASTTED